MRLLLLALTFSFFVLAGPPISVVRDFSVTGLDSTHTHANSAMLSDLPRKKHLAGKNDTASDIILCWNVTAAADCSDDFLVPAGEGFAFDDFFVKDDIFARTDGAAISTGKFNLLAW